MMSIAPELDDWIRFEIHQLTVDDRPLVEVLAAIDAFESQVEKAIDAKAHRADLLDVQRVLARLRLTRCVQLKADAELAKELFERAVAVGFADSEDGAVAAALFARVCLMRGRSDLLTKELEDTLRVSSQREPAYRVLVERIAEARNTH